MIKNMGSIDKSVRIIIAVVIALLIITNQITGTWAIIPGILAGIFLVTSFISFCPLYLPFKINTEKKK